MSEISEVCKVYSQIEDVLNVSLWDQLPALSMSKDPSGVLHLPDGCRSAAGLDESTRVNVPYQHLAKTGMVDFCGLCADMPRVTPTNVSELASLYGNVGHLTVNVRETLARFNEFPNLGNGHLLREAVAGVEHRLGVLNRALLVNMTPEGQAHLDRVHPVLEAEIAAASAAFTQHKARLRTEMVEAAARRVFFYDPLRAELLTGSEPGFATHSMLVELRVRLKGVRANLDRVAAGFAAGDEAAALRGVRFSRAGKRLVRAMFAEYRNLVANPGPLSLAVSLRGTHISSDLMTHLFPSRPNPLFDGVWLHLVPKVIGDVTATQTGIPEPVPVPYGIDPVELLDVTTAIWSGDFMGLADVVDTAAAALS